MENKIKLWHVQDSNQQEAGILEMQISEKEIKIYCSEYKKHPEKFKFDLDEFEAEIEGKIVKFRRFTEEELDAELEELERQKGG